MSEQLVFGHHTIQDALDRRSINPCVNVYGKGPTGKTCKDCKHLYAKQRARVYHKCDLRKNTNGPGTDHRVNWPACAKWEAQCAS